MIPFFIGIGHEVKFLNNGKICTGIVNKVMFPGYKFRDTNSDILRYSIKDPTEKDHSYVIPEMAVIEPPVMDIRCRKVKDYKYNRYKGSKPVK